MSLLRLSATLASVVVLVGAGGVPASAAPGPVLAPIPGQVVDQPGAGLLMLLPGGTSGCCYT